MHVCEEETSELPEIFGRQNSRRKLPDVLNTEDHERSYDVY